MIPYDEMIRQQREITAERIRQNKERIKENKKMIRNNNIFLSVFIPLWILYGIMIVMAFFHHGR